jgi:hypothetical protein
MQKSHLDLRSKNLGLNTSTSANANRGPKKPPNFKEQEQPRLKNILALAELFSY